MTDSRVARCEPLEIRRLLFSGTQGADLIHIGTHADVPRSYFIDINGVRVIDSTFATTDINRGIVIDCLAGDDNVTIDDGLVAKVTVYGGEGNDTLVGGNNPNQTSATEGGAEALLGNGGRDLLIGNGGKDVLVGGAGADTIRGGAGSDQIWGDGTHPQQLDLTTKSANDLIFGDAGFDNIEGGGGNDRIHGGADGDRLVGNDGDDQLLGEDGDDSILLARTGYNASRDGGGSDVCDGGAGADILLVASATTAINVTLDGVANDGIAGESGNVAATFERFEIELLAGGSVIDASASPAGVHVLFFGTRGVEEGLVFPHVTFIGSEFDDAFEKGGYFGANMIPQRIEGRGGNDFVEGDAGNDTLLGGAGDDTLRGDGGDDAILGDEDKDSIEGGGGDDRIAGGPGNDLVFGDSVLFVDGYGNDTIEGGAGNDSVNGGAGADRLYGNAGRDTLNGAGGNDQLFGGPTDADRILGGAGNDAAAEDEKDSYDAVETMLV